MIFGFGILATALLLSAVAAWYSVAGLVAIFSAAAIPVIIMGGSLELGKIVATVWLHNNWKRAGIVFKLYLVPAIAFLMILTSMGIFGYLSKAHSDQSLVSGDVQGKIAIYDEKIKTARENIEANRKQLKQMDEAVDQVMGRSTDEKGADKAVSVRKNQSRDRVALAKDIEANQRLIATLNDQAAPIRAEVRKVEAEVGPIKYIAKFIYGEHGADENMLERAVTWIIILIVIVFDPLAVIMLLAAQMTFGWLREQKKAEGDSLTTESDHNIVEEPTVTAQEKIKTDFEGVREPGGEWIQTGPEFATQLNKTHTEPVPSETPLTALGGDITAPESQTVDNLDQWNKMIETAEKAAAEREVTTVEERVAKGETYIDGLGQEVVLEADLPQDESKKKTYMIKDPQGQLQTKNR